MSYTQNVHEFLKERFSDDLRTWYEQNKSIHLACKYGFLEDVHDILMAFPDNINKLDVEKKTPLYYAGYCGHSHVVDALVEKGCEVPEKIGFCAHKRDQDLLTMIEIMNFNDFQWRAAEEAAEKDKKKRKRKDRAMVDDQPLFFSDLSFSQVLDKVFDEQVKGEREKVIALKFMEKEEDVNFSMKFFDPDAKRKVRDDVNDYSESDNLKSPVATLFPGEGIFDMAPTKMQIEGEMVEEKPLERPLLSDSSLSIELRGRSIQYYHTHLMVLISRWKYFRDTFMNKGKLLEKMKSEEKNLNQVVFEEISKLKNMSKYMEIVTDGKKYSEDCHEMLLKALYTGNTKFYQMLYDGKEKFKKFVSEFKVNVEDLEVRLFTTKKIMENEKKKYDEGKKNRYFEELVLFHTSDSELCTQEDVFYTHKFILTNRCHFFSLSLLGPFQTTNDVIFENESTDAVGQMVSFIYSDEIKLTEVNVIELAVLSQKFFLKRLQKSCAKFLKDWIDIENVVAVYNISLQYNLASVAPLCIRKLFRFLDDNPFLWLELRDLFRDYDIPTGVLKKTMALRYFVHLEDVKEPKPKDFVKAIKIQEYDRASFIAKRKGIKVNPYKCLRRGEMTSFLWRFFSSKYYEWDQEKLSEMVFNGTIPDKYLQILLENKSENGFHPGEVFFWKMCCQNKVETFRMTMKYIFELNEMTDMIKNFNPRLDKLFEGTLDIEFGDKAGYKSLKRHVFGSKQYLGIKSLYFELLVETVNNIGQIHSQEDAKKFLKVCIQCFFQRLEVAKKENQGVRKKIFALYKWKLSRLFYRSVFQRVLFKNKYTAHFKGKVIPQSGSIEEWCELGSYLHFDSKVTKNSKSTIVLVEATPLLPNDIAKHIPKDLNDLDQIIYGKSKDWRSRWNRFHVEIDNGKFVREEMSF